LKELERREQKRGSRRQGFARAQFKNIHKDKIYDIELDTHALSIQQCVEKVLDFYATKKPWAFEKMRTDAGFTV
jgi:chloramphenicol 3-O-phosphotransferase